MKNVFKIAAGVVLALGVAATPSLAQTFDADSASYNRDGTLNVWGAHIEPQRSQGGLLGGVGTVVGGVTGAVGGVVGGTVGAADTIVTGSIAPRTGRYGASGATDGLGYRDGRAVAY